MQRVPKCCAFKMIVRMPNGQVLPMEVPYPGPPPDEIPPVGAFIQLGTRQGLTVSGEVIGIEFPGAEDASSAVEGTVQNACTEVNVAVFLRKHHDTEGREAGFAKALYERMPTEFDGRAAMEVSHLVSTTHMSEAMRTRCQVVQGTTHILFYRKDLLHVRPNTSGDLVKSFITRVRDGRRNVTVGILEGFNP
jgi:hypothetical protein